MGFRIRLFTFSLLITGSIAQLIAQTDYPLETVLQKGHKDYIRCYDFSSDGSFLVTGGYDNSLILWELSSGKQIRIFTGHTERLRSVTFNKSGTEFLSVAADNHIKIFEVITGKELLDVSAAGIEFFNAYYSPNETYIYALTNRDDVYIWSRKTGRVKGVVKKEFAAHHEHGIFSPDESHVLSTDGYRGTAVLDVLSGDTVLTLHFDKVYSQSFSPDGAYIVVSSRKQFSSVYNAKTGELMHELRYGDVMCDGCNAHHVFSGETDAREVFRSLVGHTDIISAFDFSPDGSLMVTASWDGKVKVWDVLTGMLVGRQNRHKVGVLL
ncbi:hypothetical protein N8987_04305 [Crocinitomix sp.]|nr:hypothetical protein [Crocinitomix sp.]